MTKAPPRGHERPYGGLPLAHLVRRGPLRFRGDGGGLAAPVPLDVPPNKAVHGDVVTPPAARDFVETCRFVAREVYALR
ncbi:hypothetical protein SAMN04490356_6024 [Streptomyces melanosporofaciens]|uniref:Uncharacterized protein n=1 Tax=Streptomyces melanosporofaciens TaxID=67327 RepID=A0A1H4WCH2_STRMJ|nr:hypothetical protein SAMN04490356_6024 [Streptomyces melanosporofaciens]